jgi:hypothetical protein
MDFKGNFNKKLKILKPRSVLIFFEIGNKCGPAAGQKFSPK